MAGRIHTPRWPNRLVKPPYGAVEIDRAHPLAPDRGCYLLNEGTGYTAYDLSNRKAHGAINTASGSWHPYGRYFVAGSGGGQIQPSSSPVSGLGACSVLAQIRYFTNAGGGAVAGAWNGDTDMSTLLFTGSADVALWRVDTTTGTAKTVTGTTLVQEAGAGIYTLAGTYDGAYIRLYVNGKEEGSAAALTGVISSPTVPFWIGRYSTAISTGVISYCHFASRAWSQPEIAQLHADPYCFLRPLVRRSYGFVGGGAPPAEASGYMRLGKYWW